MVAEAIGVSLVLTTVRVVLSGFLIFTSALILMLGIDNFKGGYQSRLDISPIGMSRILTLKIPDSCLQSGFVVYVALLFLQTIYECKNVFDLSALILVIHI